MSSPRVALVSGFWAQNIGNGFFNVGGKWILDQVFGQENVQYIQDNPCYRTFYNQSKGSPKSYADLHENLDIDLLVLQGPLFTKNLESIWGAAFEKLYARGVKVLMLGAAFFKYTEEEVSTVKRFLKKYPPAAISTRDRKSYEMLKGSIDTIHDGIDSAFFVPKAFNPLKFIEKPYVFNFDRFPEPSITIGDKGQFDFDGVRWDLNSPKFQQYFSLKGKAQAYFGHLIDRRSLPESLNGVSIIRPEHRYAPHMTHKIYQHANSFVSDEVFTYFSVYANSRLTLADRVHACVMTLAYGNTAMLFTNSPRQALFDRLEVGHINREPVALDMDYLEQERVGVIEFLSKVFPNGSV